MNFHYVYANIPKSGGGGSRIWNHLVSAFWVRKNYPKEGISILLNSLSGCTATNNMWTYHPTVFLPAFGGHVQQGSKDGPDWWGMKKRQIYGCTDRKLGSGELDSDGETMAPKKLGLLIIQSWMERWGSCIPLSKGQVEMLRIGAVSVGGQCSGCNYPGGES